MPDLNLSPDYFEHRKTKRLQLKLGPDAAIYPIRIWAYAAKYHPDDGFFKGYSGDEIVSICTNTGNATGNAISILDALLDGFLEQVDGGFQIHDWVEHQGHLKAFHERAVYAAKSRWDKIANLGKKHKLNASSNATSNALSNEEGIEGIEGLVGKEKKEGKKAWPHDSNEYRIAKEFRDLFLLEWVPSAKVEESRLQSWASVVDLMIRIDGRTEETIEEICQAIHLEKPGQARPGHKAFEWKKNILSMGTLREKWNEGKLEEVLSAYRKGRK